MTVEDIIFTSGRRHLTVRIKVETHKGNVEMFEVEAYGQKQKGLSRLLFCLDVISFEYKNIDLALIRSAEMTCSIFKPRLPIDF